MQTLMMPMVSEKHDAYVFVAVEVLKINRLLTVTSKVI